MGLVFWLYFKFDCTNRDSKHEWKKLQWYTSLPKTVLMAWITKIRIRQQTRVESFAGAVIHVGQFNISVDTLNQPPATSALTSHMEKKWKRIRIQDSDSDKFWHTYMYMWDDYRQYYHLYFDFDYFILFLCSSFRNGLSCLYESENWTPGRENNFYFFSIQRILHGSWWILFFWQRKDISLFWLKMDEVFNWI